MMNNRVCSQSQKPYQVESGTQTFKTLDVLVPSESF